MKTRRAQTFSFQERRSLPARPARRVPGRVLRRARLGCALALAALLPGCRTVEGTGRHQLLFTTEGQENRLGNQAYRSVLKKEKRSTDAEAIAMVRRVGRRLAAAAPERGFRYQFTLLESKQANAFALPGGKVAVYSGILKYCRNEAGLAAVMGHEIGHAIARHGGERMTQNMIVKGLSTGLSAFLKAKGVAPTTQNIAMTAFGAGSQVGVLLPYSRLHESEADYLGLQYMAKAGYDPHEAVAFWKRFAGKGKSPPAFLSTHPASKARAAAMRKRLPEVLKRYAKSPQYGLGKPVPARYLKK